MPQPRPATPFHVQIQPIVVVKDAPRAIAFYEAAFGATESWRLMHYHRVGHCVMHVGSSEFALLEEFPEAGIVGPQTEPPSGSHPRLTLQVDDVDVVFARCVANGATALREPSDLWWGVRSCQIVDPFGHRWGIMSKIEDLSPAAMQARADEMGLYPPPEPSKPD